MKTKVSPNYWYRIIEHYNNVLNEKFYGQIYTPLVQHYMKQALEEAVNKAKHAEKDPAWHVPVHLRFDPQAHNFIVEAINPEQLEFV
jgi:hypothetical protein